MKIQKLHNTAFGTLYKTEELLNNFKNGTPEFRKEAVGIQQIIKENGLHNKENVDLFFHHDREDGFKLTISSKKQGTPHNPGASLYLKNKDKDTMTEDIVTFTTAWDMAYSPDAQDFMRNLRRIVSCFITQE